MSVNFNPDEIKVFEALENPEYEWRTIEGISKETGLSEDDVIQIMKGINEYIVKSSIPSNEGKSLFTSRTKHRKNQPLLKQVYSVFKNRAD